MLEMNISLPTSNLPIRKVMARLFQSYVYTKLEPKEHKGYSHPNGKVFKAMNFKIVYTGNKIKIKYSALDKDNEKKVAMAILSEGIKLGDIHITNTEISLIDRTQKITSPCKVGGFIAAAIKDGTSNQKIYLEPKTHKFQEIIRTNTLQKYRALTGKEYAHKLYIALLSQQPKPHIFHYNRGVIKAWYGVYKIEADKDMLRMILDTGIGAHAMQGLGFVEILQRE